MRLSFSLVLAMSLAASGGCVTPSGADRHHPEARSYDATRDASAAVDAALARAVSRDTRVLLVLGANWCHDSRALAGMLAAPRFADLLAQRYEPVFVNVGTPQTGDGQNLHIARRFGLSELAGTPTVLVLRPDGTAVNLARAGTWRNAASRSEQAIRDELAALAVQE